ncbi:hypothetical protein EJB05_56584, partial [Eragrostis curvula]
MDLTFLSTLIVLLFLLPLCLSDDQLTPTRPLIFPDKLVSSNGAFALGFFPANSSTRFYLGIWYTYNNVSKREVVWVANRDNPITASSSSTTTLAVTNRSVVVLSDQEGRIYWSTEENITTTTGDAAGAIATLSNNGNFVVSSNGTQLWQSFDHPTDTLLPGMPLRMNYRTRFVGHLVSWKSPDDPSSGDFSLGGDLSSGLQYFIWNRSELLWRSGTWNGKALPSYKPSGTTSVLTEMINANGDEILLSYGVSDESPGMHARLSHTGRYEFSIWNSSALAWTVLDAYPGPGCDHSYASCGPFAYCDSTEAAPKCKCPEGFKPKGTTPSGGCARKEKLRCGNGDRFVTLPKVKTPAMPVFVRNRSHDGCVAECRRNCSCTAYAYANLSSAIRGGDQSRCLLWFGELVDMGKYLYMDGEDLHLRLAGSSVNSDGMHSVQKKSNLTKILLPITACLVLLAFTPFVWTCKNRGKRQKKKVQKRMMLDYLKSTNEAESKNQEFPFISFQDIVVATDDFCDSNMLGKGGFGKVYKGTLEGAKEVAIKRLSKGSGQGIEEFTNEVALIAKLQHKNLVKLLGCCIQEEEKILVYEYLPNKSLDYFLFDPARKPMLQWPIRCKIIQGVARGLMYLHHDSRLTIIHRDLKASNILLDMDMSPKISDFGMAKIFCGDQNEANTNRVVGTYGYMSPEYAMEGVFSVKSDTYSFGVLLLEIVSGLKISSPNLIRDFPNLIAYAWNLWEDGTTENFVDASVKENCPLDEASRYIQIGLLCIQDNPDCRPQMSEVVPMLENKSTPLPIPMHPVYFACRDAKPLQASDSVLFSNNDMTLPVLGGR